MKNYNWGKFLLVVAGFLTGLILAGYNIVVAFECFNLFFDSVFHIEAVLYCYSIMFF